MKQMMTVSNKHNLLDGSQKGLLFSILQPCQLRIFLLHKVW